MMLNQTSRRQVDGVRYEFFRRWPDAISASRCDLLEMETLLKPLGLSNRRSLAIRKMSQQYLGEWNKPSDLFGLGRYADDSYEIFIKKNYTVHNPSDKFLSKYIDWIKH
jgi:endonuclease III